MRSTVTKILKIGISYLPMYKNVTFVRHNKTRLHRVTKNDICQKGFMVKYPLLYYICAVILCPYNQERCMGLLPDM